MMELELFSSEDAIDGEVDVAAADGTQLSMLERLIRSHPIWYLPHLQRAAAVLLLQHQQQGVTSSTLIIIHLNNESLQNDNKIIIIVIITGPVIGVNLINLNYYQLK